MSSIKKNYIYSIIYQILLTILPLITTPYISRIMGVKNIGIFSYTYSITNYFLLFSMMGVINYGNRCIASERDNRDEVSKIFWNIYFLQLITSTISLLLYYMYIIIFAKENLFLSFIWSITLISAIFDITWLFFGFEEFKITINRNIIIKVISAVAIFIFVKSKEDLWIYIFIISLSTLIGQLLLWTYIKKFVSFRKPSIEEMIKHVRPNLIMFIPVIAVSMYTIMDKIMLNNLSSLTQVGLYENAQKITIISTGIVTSLGNVMLPRMSNLYSKGNYELCEKYIEISIELIMILAIAISFGISSIAPNFSTIFFGDSFEGSGIIMSTLSYSIIFIGWANVIRTQYLIPNKKDSIYVKSVVLGAIINLIFNTFTIPKFGAIGAVGGTLCAEFTVAMYQTICVKNTLKVNKYLNNIKKYFISGIIMFIVVRYIGISFKNSVLNLSVQISTGIVIYTFITYILLIKDNNQITFYIKNLKLKK